MTITDYQKGDTLSVTAAANDDGAFANACSRVGIYLAPNYQQELSVKITYVIVRLSQKKKQMQHESYCLTTTYTAIPSSHPPTST